jgi:hypothetical protein
VIVPVVIGALLLLGVEIARWMFRPAARRIRVIKKIGGRQ